MIIRDTRRYRDAIAIFRPLCTTAVRVLKWTDAIRQPFYFVHELGLA